MQCPWGQKAFKGYLGEDQEQWKVGNITHRRGEAITVMACAVCISICTNLEPYAVSMGTESIQRIPRGGPRAMEGR